MYLGINIQTLADILHQCFLIISIVNRKICAVSQPVNIAAQNADTGGMKRGNPDTFRTVSYHLINTLPHLPRSFICKCNGHNIIWIYSKFIDQIGCAVGENPCLSRTGSRQDQKRSFRCHDRLLLLFIQCIK